MSHDLEEIRAAMQSINGDSYLCGIGELSPRQACDSIQSATLRIAVALSRLLEREWEAESRLLTPATTAEPSPGPEITFLPASVCNCGTPKRAHLASDHNPRPVSTDEEEGRDV